MSNALYHASTFCNGTYERYIPGACGSVFTWFLMASSRIFVLHMVPHEIKKRCSGVNPSIFSGRPLSFKYNCNPSDRKSTRLNSSHVKISYAAFCLKKKNTEE